MYIGILIVTGIMSDIGVFDVVTVHSLRPIRLHITKLPMW